MAEEEGEEDDEIETLSSLPFHSVQREQRQPNQRENHTHTHTETHTTTPLVGKKQRVGTNKRLLLITPKQANSKGNSENDLYSILDNIYPSLSLSLS